MFRLEIETGEFDPDWGYEVSLVLQDVARQVRGYEAGCGVVVGQVRHGRFGVVGSWRGESQPRPK